MQRCGWRRANSVVIAPRVLARSKVDASASLQDSPFPWPSAAASAAVSTSSFFSSPPPPLLARANKMHSARSLRAREALFTFTCRAPRGRYVVGRGHRAHEFIPRVPCRGKVRREQDDSEITSPYHWTSSRRRWTRPKANGKLPGADVTRIFVARRDVADWK